MTVQELIDALSKLDPDKEVRLGVDDQWSSIDYIDSRYLEEVILQG